jgi:hypothetical protein
MQLMPAITVEAKTLNNHLDFERDLWQHQARSFAGVPKRSVLGALIRCSLQTNLPMIFDGHAPAFATSFVNRSLDHD